MSAITKIPACYVCGDRSDLGHERGCPKETPQARVARLADERLGKPTRMPKITAGCENASRCCGATLDGALSDGVLVGHCSACNATVCRRNPRTGDGEWLNGGSPWTREDAQS